MREGERGGIGGAFGNDSSVRFMEYLQFYGCLCASSRPLLSSRAACVSLSSLHSLILEQQIRVQQCVVDALRSYFVMESMKENTAGKVTTGQT